MRTTASGTRALAPTTPTLTPELLAALKAIDACAAGLIHHAGRYNSERAHQIRILLEGVKSYADEGLAALEFGRIQSTTRPTRYTPGPYAIVDTGHITSTDRDHHFVAQVCHDHNGQRHQGNEALLAAAPELHQALAAVLSDYRNDLALIRTRTLKLIVSALAKVEGGEA
jgi:hypothetical protein